jgi:HSP20 family protein
MVNSPQGPWCPAVELYQTDQNLVLKAEVPGVSIKNLDVKAQPNSIVISGVNPSHHQTNEQELMASQLHYGNLYCNIPLPVEIRVDRVNAELTNGILTITMEKQQHKVMN